MAEEGYRELERKAKVRHYGTILFKRLNGESVEGIAKSLKMEVASVWRCLAWAEKNWSRIISPNGEEHTKQETSSTREDQMGKTSCALCNETIHAGQYRVVLSRVEMKPPDRDRGIPSGRGLSFYETYCDSCVAEMPLFELTNPWKMLSDDAAKPSAGPATEDATFRSVSVQKIAEKVADGMDGPGDGEALDLDALSIPRCGMHAFRHAHGSLLHSSGASLKVAQTQLRHADASTHKESVCLIC